MIKPHAAAVLALLQSQVSPIQLTVYDGVVPALIDPKTQPYVLVRFADGPPRLNFVGVSHEYMLRITCHCVAGNEAAARTVIDRVRTALQDVTPTVSGRKCYPIRWADAVTVDANERTGSVVSMAVVSYELRSVPA